MISVAIIIAAILFNAIYFWNTIGNSYKEIPRIVQEPSNEGEESSNEIEATTSTKELKDKLDKLDELDKLHKLHELDKIDKSINILVLGVDNNKTTGGRSDIIMVVRLNPEKETIHIVSVPRDTYMELAEYGYEDKVNHGFFYGGVPTVLASVEKFFDIHIDHYAMIDFVGFEKAIDTIGGIEVDVEKRISDDDGSLQPGLQILNGKQALFYVRFRHDKQADIGRISRQQNFLQALFDKSTDLRSANHIFDLMEIIGDHFKTDIPKKDMIKIVETYHDKTSENIYPYTVKGYSKRFGKFNLWYYLVKEEERVKMHDILTN